MSSRYALWVVACCISLAGCANMQTRSGSSSIGNAAGVPAPPMLSGSIGVAPPPQALDLSEPPPPIPPSAITAGPARISSAVSKETHTKPAKPYNLSSPKPNRTISKLASRSRVSLPTAKEASEPKPSADPVAESAKVEAPVPPAETASASAPDSKPAPPTEEAPTPQTDADTALLAQPVRKGVGKKESDSSSPQSGVPKRSKIRNPDAKSERSKIVPVSNPTVDEPVNTQLFS